MDAAALAGAQDLPQDTSTAISTAISYANNNKPSGTTIDTPEIMDGSRAIKVTAHKNVSLGLAKIFGSSLGRYQLLLLPESIRLARDQEFCRLALLKMSLETRMEILKQEMLKSSLVPMVIRRNIGRS